MPFKVTGSFFDRHAVIAAMDRKTRAALMETGKFLRRRAQTSMRYSKKPAAPGKPPHAHREHGAYLRKLIFYSYDKIKRTVVTGPVRLGKGIVPNLLEFGGKEMIAHPALTGRPRRKAATPAQAAAARRKFLAGQIHRAPDAPKVFVNADIEPRPYMGPALDAEKKDMPARWSGELRK